MNYDLYKYFELSLDMLCIAGADGYIKLANPSFTRQLGWNTEELLDKPFIEFVHARDVEATLTVASRLLEGSPITSFVHRFQHVDGSYRYLQWTAQPELETGLIYASARDITDLRRSQQQLAHMVESSPSPMLVIDTRGVITMTNRETERLFGYEQGELIDIPLSNLVPFEVRDKHAEYCRTFFREHLARPMGVERDLTAVKKDGSFFPVEVGLSPIETDGGRSVVCAVVDLTTRKKTETTIRERVEELDSLARIDPLTGLTNRRTFLEQLTLQIDIGGRTGGSISIIML